MQVDARMSSFISGKNALRWFLPRPRIWFSSIIGKLPVNTIDQTAPHILIIDDDPVLLEALPDTVRCRMPDAVVETADCAAAALECVAAVNYDVIVTDLVMPGMTGIDLIVKMRELRPWTPMILMSGNPNPEGYTVRSRAYGFIQKPIDRGYFIETLHRAVRYSRLKTKIQSKTESVQRYLEKVRELRSQIAEHGAKATHQCGSGKFFSPVAAPKKNLSSERS